MIGPKTIQKIKDLIGENIDTYAKKIDLAYIKAEDQKLKVSLGAELFPSKTHAGAIDIDVTISFVESKVKDKISAYVNEKQEELPLVAAVERMRPKAGSGIDSVTISSGDKSVTLNQK